MLQVVIWAQVEVEVRVYWSANGLVFQLLEVGTLDLVSLLLTDVYIDVISTITYEINRELGYLHDLTDRYRQYLEPIDCY